MTSGLEDLSDLAYAQHEQILSLKCMVEDQGALSRGTVGNNLRSETTLRQHQADRLQSIDLADRQVTDSGEQRPQNDFCLQHSDKGQSSDMGHLERPEGRIVEIRRPWPRSHPLDQFGVGEEGDQCQEVIIKAPKTTSVGKIFGILSEDDDCNSISCLQILGSEIEASAQELMAARRCPGSKFIMKLRAGGVDS